MNRRTILKTIIVLASIGVLLFFIIRTYENINKELKGEYNVLKELYEKEALNVYEIEKKRLNEKAEAEKAILEREIESAKLKSNLSSLQKNLENLKKKKISVPKDIPGLVNYFNTRYSTAENLPIDNKVGLGEKTAHSTVYELEEKDIFSDVIVLKDKQLILKDTIIDYLEKDKIALGTMFMAAENEIEERKKLQSMADENIGNLEKQIKNSNRNKTLYKILIPVSAVVGGLIGYQIAK